MVFPYFWINSLFNFSDVDECSLMLHFCDNNSSCINTDGSYICDCTGTGFEGSDCSTGIQTTASILQ